MPSASRILMRGRPPVGRGSTAWLGGVAAAAAALASATPLALGQVRTMLPPNAELARGFGMSVAIVPDADGDGRPDFLIGADQETVPELTSSGHARLYSGATGAYLRSFLPQVPGTRVFAYKVAGIGDIDGDGRGDVLVSSHLEIPPGQQGGGGVVYAFSGATGAVIHTLWSPPGMGAAFGGGLSAVPDTDGDGVPDILVGAPDGITGWAHLFSGATGELRYSLVSSFPQYGGRYGQSVAGVPDVDGDGLGDLAVGAFGENIVGVLDGRVYIYSGADGALLHTLQAPVPDYAMFGLEVVGLPDLDGDGRGDVLIGARNALSPENPTLRGRAFVHSGATGERLYTLVPPFTAFSVNWGDHVGVAPDLDGDGRPELMVSSHNMPPSDQLDSGGVVHILSGATGRLLRTLVSPNAQRNGSFGGSLAAAEVVGTARRADLLIGAPNEAMQEPLRTGIAYVFAACRADADADGRVDSRDISAFLSGWIRTVALPPGSLAPPGVHHGDFNADGAVDSGDISDFLSAWLGAVQGGC